MSKTPSGSEFQKSKKRNKLEKFTKIKGLSYVSDSSKIYTDLTSDNVWLSVCSSNVSTVTKIPTANAS